MGKIAFVFPGQGAQSAGMGLELYNHFDSAKSIFDLAGENVKKVTFEGPQEELNLTINAQPCLFAVDLAAAAALNEKGVFADGVAGFSLGEVPGLVHSGLLSLEQGLEFVNFRAQAMHECATQDKGGMFAVLGLDADGIAKACAEVEGAYPANFNCMGQIVAACSEDSAIDLKNVVAANGGRLMRLAASGAFHSPFMDKAKDEIEKYLKTVQFGDMKVPAYSNVTAEVYDNPKELIARQVNSPVLWQKTIENMIGQGFDTFIEVGPGKTLTGLIKKINKDVRTFHVYDLETLENVINSIGDNNA